MSKNQKKQQITFREAYQPPFHNSYGTIFSANHVMAFNLKSRLSDETVDRLLAILNGTSKEVVTKSEVTHKNGIIYFNEKEVFLIRGWGHLTGCGALNLPSETAARIQDEFAEWVVKRLTGKDQESIDSLKLRDALNVPELDYEKIKGDPLKGGKEDAAE